MTLAGKRHHRTAGPAIATLVATVVGTVASATLVPPGPARATPPSIGVNAASSTNDLLSSTPDSGAVLDDAPERVVLTLVEDIRSDTAQVTLLHAGRRIRLTDVDGSGAILDVILPNDTVGANIVEWRVQSTSGRDLSGHLSFTVNAGPGGLKGFLIEHTLHLVSGAIMLAFGVVSLRRYRRPIS